MSIENHELNLSEETFANLKELQETTKPGDGGNNDGKTPGTEPPVTPVTETPPVTKTETPGTTETPSDDDSEYYLDDAGNLTDSTGKVIVTKDQIQRDADGNIVLPDDNHDEVVRIKKALELELGIAFTDDKGSELAFPNTDAGVVDMVKVAAERLQQQFEEDLFTSYPEAINLINHLKAGKSVSTFLVAPTQWRQTTIPTDTDKNRDSNKALRQNILLEKEILMRTNGKPDSFTREELVKIQRDAREYVDYIMATGGETERANEALQYLRSHEDRLEKARDEENREILRKEQEQSRTFWSNVTKIVEAGNLGLVGIPKTERKAFLDYISKPVTKDGRTQEEVDFETDDIKNRVFLSYLRYKKFNLDDVLKARILDEKVKQLEGRKRTKVSVKFGEQVQPVKKTNSLDGININTITNL